MKYFTIKFTDSEMVLERQLPGLLTQMLFDSAPHWQHLDLDYKYLGGNVIKFMSKHAEIWQFVARGLQGSLVWEIGEVFEGGEGEGEGWIDFGFSRMGS